MMKHRDIAGSPGSVARLVGGAAAVVLAFGTAAGASELKIPRGHPQIVLDVPDDWSIDRTSFAVEMRSPEKNSIIVASVLAGGKSKVDDWTKEAGEKLKAFGVQFDAHAKAPPAQEAKPQEPAQPTKPAEEVKREQKAAADAKSAFTTSPDEFTFSGTPSLKAPGTEGSNRPVKPADNSIENLTGFGANLAPTSVEAPKADSQKADAHKPKLPFKAVQIYGTTMNGKPVDVQLVIYSLPADHLFVMMQESGSDDGRAVAMAQSVRRAN